MTLFNLSEIPIIVNDGNYNTDNICWNAFETARLLSFCRTSDSVGEMIPAFLGSLSHSACGDISDAWPLMQNSACCDSISFCESYSELAGVAAKSCSLETENETAIESDNNQELSDVLTSAKSPDGNIAKSFEISKHRTYIEVSSLQNSAAAESQPNTKCNGTADDSTDW